MNNLNMNQMCGKCYSDLISGDSKQMEEHITAHEMYSRNTIVPNPSVRYSNLDPRMIRHKDTLNSTERRIHQGSDFVHDYPRDNISETKDSQLRVLDLYEEFKATEKTAPQPKKSKAYLGINISGDGTFSALGSHLLPTTTSTTYRNAMQVANLKNREMLKSSVTATDFVPKIMYPWSNHYMLGPRSFSPKSPEWMKHRKVQSRFVDLDCPKRDWWHKFMDDPEQALM